MGSNLCKIGVAAAGLALRAAPTGIMGGLVSKRTVLLAPTGFNVFWTNFSAPRGAPPTGGIRILAAASSGVNLGAPITPSGTLISGKIFSLTDKTSE